mmetsp:Transcript_53664/g.170655  ORF Transcript_53664/g.170655 Transcript_53664/m.170655 type:complete len:224 (-) Transcript_53664:209-880(-)
MASESARRLSVAARSAAEMPVEVPSSRSTETVNAVPMASSFSSCRIMRGMLRRSKSFPSIATQMRPLVLFTMNAMLSSVALEAARIRSPSFSRSSSSLTTRNLRRQASGRVHPGKRGRAGAGGSEDISAPPLGNLLERILDAREAWGGLVQPPHAVPDGAHRYIPAGGLGRVGRHGRALHLARPVAPAARLPLPCSGTSPHPRHHEMPASVARGQRRGAGDAG